MKQINSKASDRKRLVYVLLDLFAAAISWSSFFFVRKYFIDPTLPPSFGIIINDRNFYIGIIIIPLFWVIAYYFTGFYKNIYQKSRLQCLIQTLQVTFAGSVILFFAVVLDDNISNYTHYYYSFIVLFITQFTVTIVFRLINVTLTVHNIHNRKLGYATLLVGGNGNALKVYQDLESQSKSEGNIFVGFLNIIEREHYSLSPYIPHLGHYADIRKIIDGNNIQEVIIAIEKSEEHTIESVISKIQDAKVTIKIIPDMEKILIGGVKTKSLFVPQIVIPLDQMPTWEQNLKRIMDIFVSIIAIIILSPVYIITGIIVWSTSKGSIIYSQERIGLHGKPFMMHKFRSMYQDAEKDGKPRLASKVDPRITPFGRFMRKVRLDEIPQFFSVLNGDMALVGPRPERKFFIDQISERAPEYRLLQKIKPGITSWGQVRYGYAENIDEMIDRMKYDLLYLENQSIMMDVKILIWTVLIVVQGRGK